MKIQLKQVDAAEKTVLANLLELYQYDLSGIESSDLDLDSTGRYGYKYLDSYWKEKGRHPFFIFADGKLAGFVLVNEHSYVSQGAKSIAEFFVLKRYRKQGIGEEAAKQVFSFFPGKWEVGQLEKNKEAQSFWRKVVANYTNGDYQEVKLDNERWHGPVQRFNAMK